MKYCLLAPGCCLERNEQVREMLQPATYIVHGQQHGFSKINYRRHVLVRLPEPYPKWPNWDKNARTGMI